MEDELQELYEDEFSVPADVVAAMRPEEKLAHGARLLETLSLAYGVSLDSHGPGLNTIDDLDQYAPAALLQARRRADVRTELGGVSRAVLGTHRGPTSPSGQQKGPGSGAFRSG